jgi:hypothetical protein
MNVTYTQLAVAEKVKARLEKSKGRPYLLKIVVGGWQVLDPHEQESLIPPEPEYLTPFVGEVDPWEGMPTQIADGAPTAADLAEGSISMAQIADGAIKAPKMVSSAKNVPGAAYKSDLFHGKKYPTPSDTLVYGLAELVKQYFHTVDTDPWVLETDYDIKNQQYLFHCLHKVSASEAVLAVTNHVLQDVKDLATLFDAILPRLDQIMWELRNEQTKNEIIDGFTEWSNVAKLMQADEPKFGKVVSNILDVIKMPSLVLSPLYKIMDKQSPIGNAMRFFACLTHEGTLRFMCNNDTTPMHNLMNPVVLDKALVGGLVKSSISKEKPWALIVRVPSGYSIKPVESPYHWDQPGWTAYAPIIHKSTASVAQYIDAADMNSTKPWLVKKWGVTPHAGLIMDDKSYMLSMPLASVTPQYFILNLDGKERWITRSQFLDTSLGAPSVVPIGKHDNDVHHFIMKGFAVKLLKLKKWHSGVCN